MVSKKLLSKVLGKKILEISQYGNEIKYVTKAFGIQGYKYSKVVETINIYELAHRCKERLHSTGYVYIEDTRGYAKIYKFGTDERKLWECDDYDFTTVFKSCEWILNKG